MSKSNIRYTSNYKILQMSVIFGLTFFCQNPISGQDILQELEEVMICAISNGNRPQKIIEKAWHDDSLVLEQTIVTLTEGHKKACIAEKHLMIWDSSNTFVINHDEETMYVLSRDQHPPNSALVAIESIKALIPQYQVTFKEVSNARQLVLKNSDQSEITKIHYDKNDKSLLYFESQVVLSHGVVKRSLSFEEVKKKIKMPSISDYVTHREGSYAAKSPYTGYEIIVNQAPSQ